MKISLQIILADARSPGRGLPPQPFDRHVSGELPDLDNIIQERESQYGDSARAGTIQLPRTARASPRGGRSPRRVQGPLPPLRVWCSGPTARLGDGPRSSHQGPTTQGAPSPGDRPPTARSLSLGCVTRPEAWAHRAAFQRFRPWPDRCRVQSRRRRRKPRPRLALESGLRAHERTRVSSVAHLSASWARAAITLSLHPWAAHLCGLLTVDSNEALGRGFVARGKPRPGAPSSTQPFRGPG